MTIPPYSIDVNGNDNQPEWGYCAVGGCPEPAYPIWYSGGFPDDPDLLLCDQHSSARILELEKECEALKIGQRAWVERGAADHAVAAAARALRAVCQPLGSLAAIGDACAVFDAAVAVADKVGGE